MAETPTTRCVECGKPTPDGATYCCRQCRREANRQDPLPRGRYDRTPEQCAKLREWWTPERHSRQSRNARLASRTRIRAGVGELYQVRQRLHCVEKPLSFPHAGKPVGERNGQG